MIPTSDIQADPRLKFMLFGGAGVGKTMASIQMPHPYVIDTEKGSVHYKHIIREKGGDIFNTTKFSDVIKAVKALATEKHSFQTLVIDPFTTLYEMAADEAEIKVGTKFGKHIQEANKQAKRLYNLLTQLDMNIAVTAHSKNLYGDKMELLGQTFDGWKKMDYLFDLVFELTRESNGKRFATVAKTRLPEFPDQLRFEWSYDALAERYGRQRIEKNAVPVEVEAKDNPTEQVVMEIEALRNTLRDLRDQYEDSFDETQTQAVAAKLNSTLPTSIEELKTEKDKLARFVQAVQSAMQSTEKETA